MPSGVVGGDENIVDMIDARARMSVDEAARRMMNNCERFARGELITCGEGVASIEKAKRVFTQ